MRDKGSSVAHFWLLTAFYFTFCSQKPFSRPSHADLIYWSCPNDLEKTVKSSERLWHMKRSVLITGFSVWFHNLRPCQLLMSKPINQSPVVAAPPVCASERAGLYWERPSNSLMSPLARSPPCCRPPGSAAPPSPSWELKVTGGRRHAFHVKMVDTLVQLKV